MVNPKYLLLLRHAKSSWDHPGLADHDRPLAPRGVKAAKRMGAHLRSEQTPVDLVLCSSAVRARETVELLAPPGALEIDGRLYGASAEELLQRVHDVADEIDAVMLVGHNPAMRDLALGLLGDAGESAVGKFPTGAMATFAFSGSWRSLAPDRAELVAFVTPRELG